MNAREAVREYRLRRTRGESLEDRDPTIAYAMQCLAVLDETCASDETGATFVATSPRTVLTARRMASVVEDLIAGAKRELVVVGFELSDRVVIRQIAARAASGVSIHLMLDGIQSAPMFTRGAWPRFAPLPRYWTTGIGADGKTIRLHSKALLADGHTALVGSANLTYSGLRRNLEIGVLLEGRIAADMRHYLEELIRRKLLIEGALASD
jgi:phosphatidylserine/phosphatidylglycerophosphate/cardiolipin synthase-like enzyme